MSLKRLKKRKLPKPLPLFPLPSLSFQPARPSSLFSLLRGPPTPRRPHFFRSRAHLRPTAAQQPPFPFLFLARPLTGGTQLSGSPSTSSPSPASRYSAAAGRSPRLSRVPLRLQASIKAHRSTSFTPLSSIPTVSAPIKFPPLECFEVAGHRHSR
jgi:hypothetical protein